jgi:hypothetical protein
MLCVGASLAVNIVDFIDDDDTGLALPFLNLNEAIAVLEGRVTRSRDSALLRTPVVITADGSTGSIMFDLGPIPVWKAGGGRPSPSPEPEL